MEKCICSYIYIYLFILEYIFMTLQSILSFSVVFNSVLVSLSRPRSELIRFINEQHHLQSIVGKYIMITNLQYCSIKAGDVYSGMPISRKWPLNHCTFYIWYPQSTIGQRRRARFESRVTAEFCCVVPDFPMALARTQRKKMNTFVIMAPHNCQGIRCILSISRTDVLPTYLYLLQTYPAIRGRALIPVVSYHK